jgi:hypothetical protein
MPGEGTNETRNKHFWLCLTHYSHKTHTQHTHTHTTSHSKNKGRAARENGHPFVRNFRPEICLKGRIRTKSCENGQFKCPKSQVLFSIFFGIIKACRYQKKLEIAEVEREGSGNVKVAAVIDTSRWKRNESNTDHTSSRSQAAFHCAGWHYFSYYSALIEELLLFDSLLLLGRAAYGTASDES